MGRVSPWVLVALAGIPGCGYTLGPTVHSAHGVALGRVTVRDPDPVLATGARGVITRALLRSLGTGPDPRVLDLEVSVVLDDMLPGTMAVTPTGVESLAARAVVQLRASWHEGSRVLHAEARGVGEVPAGVDAPTATESLALARRGALEDAVQALTDALVAAGW